MLRGLLGGNTDKFVPDCPAPRSALSSRCITLGDAAIHSDRAPRRAGFTDYSLEGLPRRGSVRLNCAKKYIGRRPRRARVYERRRRRNRAEARERGARAKIRRACQSERLKRLSQVSARNRVLPPLWSRASVLKANWDVLPRTSTPDFDAKIPIQWAASPPRSLQPVCYIASDLTLRTLMLLLDLLHAHRASNATPRTFPST